MLDIREEKLNTFVFNLRDDRTLNAIKNYFIDNYTKIKTGYLSQTSYIDSINQIIEAVKEYRMNDEKASNSFFFTVYRYNDKKYSFYLYTLKTYYNDSYVRGKTIQDFIEWKDKIEKGEL